jgi:HD-GYP domain-containing protein (c-di-GMP phosphodiesterase class II)
VETGCLSQPSALRVGRRFFFDGGFRFVDIDSTVVFTPLELPMTVRMDKLIKAIAIALDIVEGELLGASTHHGKRVATLSAAMGRKGGMNDDEALALTTCALLHDNALTEYIFAERGGKGSRDPSMRLHCERGQRNVDALMFQTDIRGFVLYHHERPTGRGPFGKKEGEYPLGAELIGIADTLDVVHHLQRTPPEGLADLRRTIAGGLGQNYTKRAGEMMLDVLDAEMLARLRDENIIETAEEFIPAWTVDMQDQVILNLAGFITRIIDYKSVFTRRHSTQIANRAWLMGGYYHYDPAQRAQLYLAAALHDIGKLATPVAILEKPGKLDDAEFRIITDHVRYTGELLKDITGFERIRDWASGHHEKLDGSGYPFGKKAADLDFNTRLMACIDIYQAVSEERPYHPRRGHGDTMAILYDMARAGLIDEGICRDLDETLAAYSGRDVPPPVDAPPAEYTV